MAEGTSIGRFVWHDLMTHSQAASIRFYTDLLKWELQDFDMGPSGVYKMMAVEGRALGGFMDLPDGMNVPPHWLACVAVDDVDSACASVRAHGGQILKDPMPVGDFGRYAVITDPTGGALAFYQSGDSGEPPMPSVGTFCWDELMSPDPQKAAAFFEAVLGWTFSTKPMGGLGDYHTAMLNGAPVAGITGMPPGMEQGPGFWISYVFVADLEESVARAAELGAEVTVPPMPVPEVGRIALIRDPQGATVGLFGDPIMPE